AIGPIVPDTAKSLLGSQREVEFNYGCAGAGPFTVHVWRGAGGFAARFTPGETAAPSAAPSAAPAAPAPRSGAARSTPSRPSRPAPSSAPARPAAADNPFQQAAPAPRRLPNARAQSDGLCMEDLFQAMFAANASDLHLSVSMPPMVRKDGQMMRLEGDYDPLGPEDARRLLMSVMPQKNVEEFERRHDTDFAHEIPNLARFRANVFMDRKGIGGVFRVIPNELLTAEKLGLSPHILRL